MINIIRNQGPFFRHENGTQFLEIVTNAISSNSLQQQEVPMQISGYSEEYDENVTMEDSTVYETMCPETEDVVSDSDRIPKYILSIYKMRIIV